MLLVFGQQYLNRKPNQDELTQKYSAEIRERGLSKLPLQCGLYAFALEELPLPTKGAIQEPASIRVGERIL
jgi:hypothetical protein